MWGQVSLLFGSLFSSLLLFESRADEGVVETIISFVTGVFEDWAFGLGQRKFPGPCPRPNGLVLNREAILNDIFRSSCENAR
jgi:hypothetical protein